MEQNDKQDFMVCLIGISELYRQPLSDAVVMLWWGSLKSYPLEALRKAFTAYVKTPGKKFMPAIGDIIEMLDGSTVDNAVLAWQEALNAIKDHSAYASVKFTDPVTMQVISEMGGWVKFCEVTDFELPFRSKDFERLYRAYSARGNLLSPPEHLPGLHEIGNANAKLERGIMPHTEIKQIGGKVKVSELGEKND